MYSEPSATYTWKTTNYIRFGTTQHLVLSWDAHALFKSTSIELQLLFNIDGLLFFENSILDGVSMFLTDCQQLITSIWKITVWKNRHNILCTWTRIIYLDGLCQNHYPQEDLSDKWARISKYYLGKPGGRMHAPGTFRISKTTTWPSQQLSTCFGKIGGK